MLFVHYPEFYCVFYKNRSGKCGYLVSCILDKLPECVKMYTNNASINLVNFDWRLCI